MAERSAWSPVALGEAGLVVGLGALLACLPARLAYALGEGAGALAYRWDRRHREVAQENLAQAFPEMRPIEVERLARAVFSTLGRSAVDVARSGRLLRTSGMDAVILEGFERLISARDRGRGVLLIAAHFGPWEILPLVAALRYEPIHLVARPLDNPWLDAYLATLRRRGENHIIRKQEGLQTILRVLRDGGTVGMLIDQHIREQDGVVVPFFGRPASTVPAAALVALRSGAAVLPAAILREAGPGRYRVRIGEEVTLTRSKDLKTDLVENTARFTAAMEAMIRQRPEQWFWVHRRWKTHHPLDPRLTLNVQRLT
ncbi:MAG: lysophospholipid acyltransferase family protein [candidate division NC10 bacterium]|nr:lysophospholipid acyltransferase family protein [candidate division NC10 bacterium]